MRVYRIRDCLIRGAHPSRIIDSSGAGSDADGVRVVPCFRLRTQINKRPVASVQTVLDGFVKIVFRPFSTTVLLAVGHNSDDEFVRAVAGLTDGFERLSSGVIQRGRTPWSILAQRIFGNCFDWDGEERSLDNGVKNGQ